MSDHPSPSPSQPPQARDANRSMFDLARRLRSGAGFELLGSLFGLGVRFASNLVLTRLLFPEAFGLSALVVTVIFGLIMLSDVGIAPAVIQSARGEEPAFLDTAFTLQVVRALSLWLVLCVLALPLAHFLAEPQLAWLLPSGGLAVLIHGFCSTRVLTLRRHIRTAPLVLLELGSQLVGVASTIAFAALGLGVWSLVFGNLLSALVATVASHLLPGSRHHDRFRWEAQARGEIVHFGRWILASSALTFGVARGDQLALARLMGAESLGLYNLAFALSEAVDGVAQRVIHGVLYPLFAHVHNQAPGELARAYYRVRLGFDTLVQTGLGAMCVLSPWLVALLYDARYREAGPMLSILVVRVALGLVLTPCEVLLTAQGLSEYSFRRTVALAIGMLSCVPLGYALGGALGLLWGTALARVLALPVLWLGARERGLFRPARELVPVLAFGLGAGLGRVVLPFLSFGP